jgi:Arm DNA-binding domain
VAYVQKRITKSGSGAYIVKWKDPDGKHQTKGGFRTRKAAEDYATETADKIRRGMYFEPKAVRVPFRDAAQQWLASRHDLKPTTKAGYEAALACANTRRGDEPLGLTQCSAATR